MTEKINITTENICTERKKFQVPNQTFRVLTLNGVTTVAAYENGKFYPNFTPVYPLLTTLLYKLDRIN